MTSYEEEYGEDEKEYNLFLSIRSREKIEEYMTNKDRSKFLINF
jgi:hypothetical protein